MTNELSLKNIMWALIVLTLAAGAFSSILFTELGQFLNLPSSWLYAVYPNLGWASVLVIMLCLFVLFFQYRYKLLDTRIVIGYVVVIAGMVFVTNYFVPEIWLRGHHHTAEFISVTDADVMLEDNDDVFVLEINGEARAYPRDWMMIPHIAGDTIGGEDVVMTYCALSNLPLPFSSQIMGEQSHLKVVSQVHNNLVMVDESSGELYQQITATAPDGSGQLDPEAALRMPWRSFKEIYPEGLVFHVVETGLLGLLDKVTYTLFVSTLEGHYEGEKPLFPTLSMDDDRLPAKEKIWGLNINGEQVAYTRSFLEQQPLHNTTVGGEPVLLAWFPEYETLGVFSRKINNEVIDVTNTDVHGVTTEGKLERLPQYPHVFWMIWSHWYPGTSINS
jgi:hypothetical protein